MFSQNLWDYSLKTIALGTFLTAVSSFMPLIVPTGTTSTGKCSCYATNLGPFTQSSLPTLLLGLNLNMEYSLEGLKDSERVIARVCGFDKYEGLHFHTSDNFNSLYSDLTRLLYLHARDGHWRTRRRLLVCLSLTDFTLISIILYRVFPSVGRHSARYMFSIYSSQYWGSNAYYL